MISAATRRKLERRETFKLVTFGDSVTYGARCQGWYDEHGATWNGGDPSADWNSWANLIHRTLQAINPNMTFVNEGAPGEDSAAGAARVTTIEAHAADLITVGFGINDCNASVAIATFETNMQAIIDGLSGEIVLVTPTPVAYASRTWGWPYATISDRAELGDYADSVRSLAVSNGLACIDPWRMFERQHHNGFTGRKWLNNQGDVSTNLDGEHPGELGHAMVYAATRRELLGNRRV